MSPTQPTAATPILPLTTGDMTPTPTPFESLLNWDKEASYSVYRAYNAPRLPHLLLEYSAHGVPWLITPALVFLLSPGLHPRTTATLLNFLALTVVDLLVIAVLKPSIRRSRPSYNSGIAHVTIHAVDQYAFPSGHATRAAFVTTFLLYAQLHHPKGLHPLLATHAFLVVLSVWAVAVCFSRVALGRHHILDVLCGAAIGSVYVFLWAPAWFSDSFAQLMRDQLRDFLPGYIRLVTVPSILNSH